MLREARAQQRPGGNVANSTPITLKKRSGDAARRLKWMRAISTPWVAWDTPGKGVCICLGTLILNPCSQSLSSVLYLKRWGGRDWCASLCAPSRHSYVNDILEEVFGRVYTYNDHGGSITGYRGTQLITTLSELWRVPNIPATRGRSRSFAVPDSASPADA